MSTRRPAPPSMARVALGALAFASVSAGVMMFALGLGGLLAGLIALVALSLIWSGLAAVYLVLRQRAARARAREGA